MLSDRAGSAEDAGAYRVSDDYGETKTYAEDFKETSAICLGHKSMSRRFAQINTDQNGFPQKAKIMLLLKLNLSFSPTFRLGSAGPETNRKPFQWFTSARHSKAQA
jgi:hypothetical protein